MQWRGLGGGRRRARLQGGRVGPAGCRAAAGRAEIVQAAIEALSVREQPFLEPSWQPGRAQGQYEPDAEAELEI